MNARHLLFSVALAGLLAFGSASATVVSFGFTFDNTPDGSVSPPLVGTGSLGFDDPGNGTFDFFSLTGVSLSFDFGSTVFGLADLTTTAGAQVILSGTGVDRSLVFTGVGDGFASSSLDFQNGATDLSFGPTGSEGLYYAQVAGGDILYHGDYAAQAQVPAPGTLALLGLGAMGMRNFRKRRDAAMAEAEIAR